MGVIRLGAAGAVPLLALLAMAAAWDVRTRRVPNWLTLGGALAGLGANLVVGHGPGALLSASGWLVGIALLLVPYLLGAMGGGDVKLLGMAGARGGPGFALATRFYGALVGGAIALALLLRERWLFRDPILLADPIAHAARRRGWWPVAVRPGRTLAYAPALALGGLIAYLAG